MSQMGWLRPLGLWRDYQSGKADRGPASFLLGIAASYTAESLIPFIGGALLDKGWQNFNVVAAPFNQIFQTCLEPESAFAGQLPDQIVIAWRLEDIFPGLLAESWQFKDTDLETMLDLKSEKEASFERSFLSSFNSICGVL